MTVRLILLAAALTLAGCSNTRLLKEPLPQPVAPALASAASDRLEAHLEWVIIRDGPGSWVEHADWDEYLFSVRNLSDQTLVITQVSVVDSLGTVISRGLNRDKLVKGTRDTARRYEAADIPVYAGMSGVGMFATGTGLAVAGTYVALQSVLGVLAGSASSAFLAPVAAGAIYAAPVVMFGGIARGVNNARVNSEILKRQTELPLTLAPGEARVIDLMYPIAPSPRQVIIHFGDKETLILDTSEALRGLHLESLPPETLPGGKNSAGSDAQSPVVDTPPEDAVFP